MSIARLTNLAWFLFIAFYIIRAFLFGDPASELLWKQYFRGETGLLDRAEAVLWVPVIVLNLLALLGTVRKNGFSLAALWHLGLVALCVFLFGEEVSWGQHIFGFQASDTMLQINAQQENNIHNLNLALLFGVPAQSALYPWLTNFNHLLNPAYYLLTCVLWIGIPVGQRLFRWRLLDAIPAINGRIVVFCAANVLAYLVVDKLLFDVGEVFECAITTTFALAALDMYRAGRPANLAAQVVQVGSPAVPSGAR